MKFVKKIGVIFIFIISSSIYGQGGVVEDMENMIGNVVIKLSEMYLTEIEMDIDLNAYQATDSGNIYSTPNGDSAIIGVVIPFSVSTQMLGDYFEKGAVYAVDTSEVNKNKIISFKTNLKNKERSYTITHNYKKINKDTVIMIQSFFVDDKKEKYKALIEKAVVSAKLKEL